MAGTAVTSKPLTSLPFIENLEALTNAAIHFEENHYAGISKIHLETEICINCISFVSCVFISWAIGLKMDFEPIAQVRLMLSHYLWACRVQPKWDLG